MERERKNKKVPAIVTIFLVILGLIFGGVYYLEEETPVDGPDVQVFFIDIGKYGKNDTGESFYIRIADIDIVVDSGQYGDSFQAIQEVIDSNSTDKIIDYVIATHPDSDHIGNMDDLFQAYQILNLIRFYGSHSTVTYNDFVNEVALEDLVSECVITDCVAGLNNCKDRIDLKDGVFIKIIDTQNYTASETNSRSVVFVLEAYGTRILFTGDADNKSNSHLEADYMDSVGNIDILKMVHHGTQNGTTSAFLEAVDPEYVIITNGNYFNNSYGHPTPEAINRVYQYDPTIAVYALVGGDSGGNPSVDRNGTILITINNQGFTIFAALRTEPIELSDTEFWSTHPERIYSHEK